MGEVYRARDTKLNRDVALKILPDAFAADPDRLTRFTREAQTLASLNHPNIAQIHGLEDRFVGPARWSWSSWTARTSRSGSRKGLSPSTKPSPSPDNRRRHRSRARAGHRPSRSETRQRQGPRRRHGEGPGLRPGESARGIGNAAERAGSLSLSPTYASPAMTGVGMIMGTAAYMSPEQAKGKVGGQARRHLVVRRRALRDADRARAVPGRDGIRSDGVGDHARARSDRTSVDRAALAPPRDRPLPRQGSEAPPQGHRRSTSRAGRIAR